MKGKQLQKLVMLKLLNLSHTHLIPCLPGCCLRFPNQAVRDQGQSRQCRSALENLTNWYNLPQGVGQTEMQRSTIRNGFTIQTKSIRA